MNPVLDAHWGVLYNEDVRLDTHLPLKMSFFLIAKLKWWWRIPNTSSYFVQNFKKVILTLNIIRIQVFLPCNFIFNFLSQLTVKDIFPLVDPFSASLDIGADVNLIWHLKWETCFQNSVLIYVWKLVKMAYDNYILVDLSSCIYWILLVYLIQCFSQMDLGHTLYLCLWITVPEYSTLSLGLYLEEAITSR